MKTHYLVAQYLTVQLCAYFAILHLSWSYRAPSGTPAAVLPPDPTPRLVRYANPDPVATQLTQQLIQSNSTMVATQMSSLRGQAVCRAPAAARMRMCARSSPRRGLAVSVHAMNNEKVKMS